MSDSSLYRPAVLMLVAFLFKLPGALRHRRDPLVRSVTALLAVASAVLFLAGTPSPAWVNRLSGAPNFAAPLVYGLLTACSGCAIVLLIRWRGGPPVQVRKRSRWCLGAYSFIIAALSALSAAGDTPVERLRDFDTYYANTPFIREITFLYLVAHIAAALVVTVLCWRWSRSRSIPGLLRAGLVLLVIGNVLSLGYGTFKFAAVGARWAGVDSDVLSTDVARSLASSSALLVGIGFLVPLVGQRFAGACRPWAAYLALGPLWRALHEVLPADGLRIGMRPSGKLQLMRRESVIHDGHLALAPYVDPLLRAQAYDYARSRSAAPDQAEALADAVMVVAALRARSSVCELAPIVPVGQYAPGRDYRPGHLARVSRHLRGSSSTAYACLDALASPAGVAV
ncbi:MAB_1171c family putative transporter [Streptomyces sp. NPDC096205]|uniref:MAB_1171c family putative transporter n=1 Tax=Streptomyces sp. NPDC096205 TaxID=3366081 RepID=UPI003800AA94